MGVEQTAAQTTAVTDLPSYQTWALEQQAANNEWSAAQAQKQMDYQERMSNTAHQREVADLKAAGLNPILSANSGASVPNGAQGETDTSASGNVGAILQQVLQAQSAREVAGMYNAATIAAATIAANASMYGSDMNYWNTEDHPKTPEEVAARLLYKDSGNVGSHAPSNGSNSGAYTSASSVASEAGSQGSSTMNALENIVKGVAKTASNWYKDSGAMKSVGNAYYDNTVKWLKKNNLTINSKDLAYFKLICLAKGSDAGYKFLQQLMKSGRIGRRQSVSSGGSGFSGHNDKF